MRDGIVLGVSVGLGFAAFESAGYAFNALFTSNGLSLLDVVETEVLRGILTPIGHGVWTGILGGTLFAAAAGYGKLRVTRAPARLESGRRRSPFPMGLLPRDRGSAHAASHQHPTAVAHHRVRSRANNHRSSGSHLHHLHLGIHGVGWRPGPVLLWSRWRRAAKINQRQPITSGLDGSDEGPAGQATSQARVPASP
jgi:hypothetical protein